MINNHGESMLREIADVTGYPYSSEDGATLRILQRIASKIPGGTDPTNDGFRDAVCLAEETIDLEGKSAIAALVTHVTADPPPLPEVEERVLKIKSSPKGTRIKVAAPSGIRYSFGPVWNSHVCSAGGFAVSKNNRHKLDYQAFLYGIAGAESMDAVELCKVLAPKILAQQELEAV